MFTEMFTKLNNWIKKYTYDSSDELTEENVRKLDIATDSFDLIESSIKRIDNEFELNNEFGENSLVDLDPFIELTKNNVNVIDSIVELTEDNVNRLNMDTEMDMDIDTSSNSSSFYKQKHKRNSNSSSHNVLSYYSAIMRRKLRPNIHVDKNILCTICNTPFENGLYTLMPCDHGFHHSCINQWLKQTQSCPVCEIKLTDDIPTKEYIQEKYSPDYLIRLMSELGIGVDHEHSDENVFSNNDNDNHNDNDNDHRIKQFIQYFTELSLKKTLRRKSSNDSITLSE